MSYSLDQPFERLHPRITDWVTNIVEWMGQSGDVTHHNVYNVENKACDGFYPYTDGGVDGLICASMAAAHDSGCVPKAVQPYLDAELKEVAKAWDEAHSETPYALLFDDNVQPALSSQMARDRARQFENRREDYYEFEQEYMREGGTYFYKVRALYYAPNNSNNITGEPEVYFFIGINTDFEYGRDYVAWLPYYGKKAHQTEWTWERTVKAKDCTPSLLARMLKPAKRALEKC